MSRNYRKIIHVDMDSFFASVEQHDNPELQGVPIAVGYDGKRGVVATASYEARPFGVHSAMPVSTAKRLCPQLVVVEPHFQRYKEISSTVHAIFREYTDLIEPISLDEAFLDVTVNKKGIELAVDIAKEIKRSIFEQTGLTASAGVSYNKLLAKIASDWRKPDGLCTVHPDRGLEFIGQLKVEKIWGVGPKTAAKMHQMAIYTGNDLRAATLLQLTQAFGKKAARLFYDFARGVDNRPVVTEYIRKSVGCEETFLEDIWAEDELVDALGQLAVELKRRVDRQQFEGYTFTLKVKFSDFTQISRSQTLKEPIVERESFLQHAEELLRLLEINEEHPVRLLGISVSNPLTAVQDDWVLDLEWE